MTLPSHLPGQFLLSVGALPGGVGTGQATERWRHFAKDALSLLADADLPVHSLRDSADTHSGWLLGWAVGSDSAPLVDPYRFDRLAAAIDALYFERWLYAHGGRFACVIDAPGLSRLYLDPLGSLATVYRLAHGSFPLHAGSTNTLLALAAGRGPTKTELRRNEFLPAGLTPDAEVHRLLPNHCLDLRNGEVLRHHLRVPLPRLDEQEAATAVSQMRIHASRTMAGISKLAAATGTRAVLGLTAGRDSRMLLAAAHSIADELELFTFDYPAEPGDPHGTADDVEAACDIARSFGLAHQVVPVTPEDAVHETTKDEYLYRIGYAGNAGKARDFLEAVRTRPLSLSATQPLFTGYGGEIGRGYYWKHASKVGGAEAIRTPHDLLRVMSLPADVARTRAIEEWMASFEWDDPYRLLDMLYLENRVGCWAAVHAYGTHTCCNIMPLSHRVVVDTMLRLSIRYREAQRLAEDFIRAGWPALNDIAYARVRERARSRRRGSRGLRARRVNATGDHSD